MTKKSRELLPIRDYTINEASKMIHQSRFNLSTREQRIVLFMISKIEPIDTELKELEFSLLDFYKVCGLDGDNSRNYLQIKKIIKDLHDKGFDIVIKNVLKTKGRWIKGVLLSRKNGTITFTMDKNLEPYLIQLRAKFTKPELMYMLEMKNQYALKLYEILKSYVAQHEKEFSIAELSRLLFIDDKIRFASGKSKILDMAIEEINAVSDLNVFYELRSDDSKNTNIVFTMEIKKEQPIPGPPEAVQEKAD